MHYIDIVHDIAIVTRKRRVSSFISCHRESMIDDCIMCCRRDGGKNARGKYPRVVQASAATQYAG